MAPLISSRYSLQCRNYTLRIVYRYLTYLCIVNRACGGLPYNTGKWKTWKLLPFGRQVRSTMKLFTSMLWNDGTGSEGWKSAKSNIFTFRNQMLHNQCKDKALLAQTPIVAKITSGRMKVTFKASCTTFIKQVEMTRMI